MSQLVRGVLGAIAISGTLGAAQLAVGGDLGQALRVEAVAGPATSISQAVNRAGKADRAIAARAVPSGPTVALNLMGQSILVKVPQEQLGDALRRVPIKPEPRKAIVACEPVVSVLTEVAKQLQPGRCVA
jgi:hypothetical protein